MYSAFGPNLSRLPTYLDNRFTKSRFVSFCYTWQNIVMQKKKKRKRTEIILRKMSHADGERDIWTDKQTTLIFWDPICKEGIWQFFRSFENIIFLIYLALFWAIWNELIYEKGIKSTQLSAQRIQKQMFRVNLYNITFILFECYRSINKSIDFYFYFHYCEGLHGNEGCSPGNSKARHESQITSRWVELRTISISIKLCFTQKLMTNFFKIKKKPCFGVIFIQREFFLKTLATCNCNGPPAFKCYIFRVDWS